jgi:integrase
MRPRGNEFGVYPKKVHGSYRYYYWVYDAKGKRIFKSTGKRSRDEAVKFCRALQVRGQLYNNKQLSFSIYTKDFFDYEKCPYITHRLSRGYTYTRAWARRQQRYLEIVIRPYFSNHYINTITYNDIDMFIMSLKNKNFSNKKINHILNSLKNIFNYAEFTGVIDDNLCKKIKAYKVIYREKGILSNEEIKRLFQGENRNEIFPEKAHFAISYLAASTGLRLGEILALRTNDITTDHLRISHSFNPYDGLKTTKNGKTRIIPLNPKLKKMLDEVCVGKDTEQYLFSYNNGKSPMVHKSVYRRFCFALEKIGINKEERKRRNITFNSYRHGVNTMLLKSGLPPETVRLTMGHSSSFMTAHYAHLTLPDILGLDENSTPNDKEPENNKFPLFIQNCINKAIVFPDGKRVATSLKDVAIEMKKQGIRASVNLLYECFTMHDGRKYSLSGCKKAVNSAYEAIIN